MKEKTTGLQAASIEIKTNVIPFMKKGQYKMTASNVVAIYGDWLVHDDRASVYAILSDFERMPEHFPKVARSIKLLKRDGDMLMLEAEAGSFASWLPTAKIELTVTLLPNQGYRCSTRNLTFHTTGEEELLLFDDPEGTRIKYTYFVTVRNRWFKPIFAWMVKTIGLPFWKRSFIDPLELLVNCRVDCDSMPVY